MVCKSNKAKSKRGYKNVDTGSLLEKGRIQFFYHSPSSKLPIRDVLNEQREGNKTEPHIEIGAENYWACCYQRNNIIPFIKNNEKYLFLMTTCRNKELKEFYRKKFIVGYIVKQIIGQLNGPKFIKGDTYLFSFEDAIPIESLGWHYKLRGIKLVNEEETKAILDHFSNKTNILNSCVNEIRKLDKNNKTCLKISENKSCEFEKECLRWNR